MVPDEGGVVNLNLIDGRIGGSDAANNGA